MPLKKSCKITRYTNCVHPSPQLLRATKQTYVLFRATARMKSTLYIFHFFLLFLFHTILIYKNAIDVTLKSKRVRKTLTIILQTLTYLLVK